MALGRGFKNGQFAAFQRLPQIALTRRDFTYISTQKGFLFNTKRNPYHKSSFNDC